MVDTWSVHVEVFGGRMKSMSPLTLERREKRRPKSSAVAVTLINLNLLLLLFYAVPIPSYGRGRQQEQSREPLGSLTGVGEVYLNDSPATGESTIFSGDRIRTAETGAATFSMGGKGTLKISPRSQVVFSGNYQFTADLEAGTIVLNTITGPNGLTLRIGNYVVVSYSRKQAATPVWSIDERFRKFVLGTLFFSHKQVWTEFSYGLDSSWCGGSWSGCSFSPIDTWRGSAINQSIRAVREASRSSDRMEKTLDVQCSVVQEPIV